MRLKIKEQFSLKGRRVDGAHIGVFVLLQYTGTDLGSGRSGRGRPFQFVRDFFLSKFTTNSISHIYIESTISEKNPLAFRMRVKTDFVQSSSNTCKNYVLKIYSQHVNFLDAI